MRNQDLVSQKAPIVRFIGLAFHTSYGNLWKKTVDRSTGSIIPTWYLLWNTVYQDAVPQIPLELIKT